MASSFARGDKRLGPDIFAPLARQKINLTLLGHVAGDRGRGGATVFCTAGEVGEGSLALLKAHHHNRGSWDFQANTCILTLFPHDKRPEIFGNFLHSLAQGRVAIRALASSPSALSAVFAGRAKNRALQQVFEHFAFPAYQSPREFFAAQGCPERYLREVIATYQEKVIKIYCLVEQSDLDLWEVSLPSREALEALAGALRALGALGLSLPFLVAVPGLPKKELRCSFCLAGGEAGGRAREILQSYLPGVPLMRHTPVAGLFMHGPHFGDRYGIALTLAQALENAQVPMLSLSCAVSSMSVIVRQEELARALLVLGKTFEAPVACRP